MIYYIPCRLCGAHLDPGESCTDCKQKAVTAAATDRNGTSNTSKDIISQTFKEASKNENHYRV